MMLRGWRVLVAVALAASAVSAGAAENLSITAEPYLTGGLFTNPALPQEEEEVRITVRATCTAGIASDPCARVTVFDGAGAKVAEKTLTLKRVKAAVPGAADGGAETTLVAEGAFTWSSAQNGLYTVWAQVDPENAIAEADEEDNAAEIVLPVIVKGKGRGLHFPWYSEEPAARWATCVTSSKGEEQQSRLAERGVTALNWEYGGMSWSYYDKENAKANPEDELAKLEQVFYE
ncbi:MAG: hypothetical protein JXR94_08870, partial [Candidatus Hydrogenedentes bacterium]|nr:hypothetical protein [Candidatus Hydrogenedentota bacterium]